MTDSSPSRMNSLPVIVECDGCGVCCFHMGYPAFVLPREPMTDEEIDASPALLKQIQLDPRLRDDLKAGNEGESYWHDLPEALREQWQAHVDNYQVPDYGKDPETFDGPCLWLDLETRRCRHHEHRPQVCRDFETGNPECLEWRRYYQHKLPTNRPDAN